MANLNNLTKDIVENKANLRELELRIKALVRLLEKEGILIEAELDQEFYKLIKEKKPQFGEEI